MYCQEKRESFIIIPTDWSVGNFTVKEQMQEMLSSLSVRKPMTIVVAVIMVIVLGVVSFTGMTTDLLPSMDLPYILVMTTYPGASPEKVETAVTRPLEQTLTTTSGVNNISSISNENVSILILEFNQSVNMDSVMIEMNNNLDLVKAQMDDAVGTPTMIKVNPDMLPVMIASVDAENMDLTQLSEYIENDVLPAFERIDGVASVTTSGALERQVHITLDQSKIDALNIQVLASVNKELAEAQQELLDAQQKINEGYQELNDGKNDLEDSKKELEEGEEELDEKKKQAYQQLAEASLQLDQASASLSAILAQEQVLTAQQKGLEGEKQLLQSMSLVSGIDNIIASIPSLSGKTVADLTAEDYIVLQQAVPQLSAISLEQLQSMYAMLDEYTPEYIARRTQEIDAELANIETNIATMQATKQALQEQYDQANEAYKALEEGKYEAIGEITKGEITISSGKTALEAAEEQLEAAEEQLKTSQEQLQDGLEQFEQAREDAYKAANLDGILTKDMISTVLTAQNFNMPAGSVTDHGQDYTVKVGEAYSSLEELENTVLFHMKNVGDIRLSDVATVAMVDNADESYAKVNGNDGIILSFQKQSTASTANVADEIKKVAASLSDTNTDFRFTALMDQGIYIDMVISSVLQNLLYGGILAILILVLFLKDIKPTIIISFSIPISLLFAVVLMYFSGVTLNVISLSGLALGVGMLVDNSIVVIENIYRLRNEGYSMAQAAVSGAKQVAGAIMASTLTTICVFLPIVFTEGISRQLFTDMGLTIAYSLIASLLVALTLVPAMASRMLTTAVEKPHKLYDKLIGLYDRSLKFSLKHKAPVLIITVVLLVISAVSVTTMGTDFIPEMDSTQMSITMAMPDESTEEETVQTADEIVNRLLQFEDVQTVGAISGGSSSMMSLGSSGGNSISFYINLKEDKQNTNLQLKEQFTDALSDLNCELNISTSNMDMSALGGSGLEIEVLGDDLDTIRQIATDVADIVSNVEGTMEVDDGMGVPAMQTIITVDKDAAMRYGYTVAQIYSEVSTAITGEQTSTTLTVGNDNYPVIIVSDPDSLPNNTTLGDLVLTGTYENEEVDFKLSDVATITTEEGMSSIQRYNQTRYVAVTASIDADHNIGLVSREIENRLAEYDLPEGYSIEIAGENELINETLFELVKMILLAIVFIYLIMVAQFQSLLSPFIVMFTIPLAFTGGLLALLFTGNDLSIVAMLGFLVLSGVVVNNGIVFVDYVNQLRLEGMEKREALITTGHTRMRPILMTALTTILAMSTMALGIGSGSDMTQPMAIVTIGGLTYATLLTLYVVPILYDIFQRKPMKKVEVEEV